MFVHLLPSLIPPGALAGGVAVVVDVLRATSVMVQALASGVEAIVPCVEVDEAFRERDRRPPGSVVLGGERQGLPIDGFDLGNSPGDYTPEVCRGKTLVMTTTNGTRAILASLDAERVLVASFSNLRETASALRREARPVHLVCAGTDGHVSYEDTLFAGALAFDLALRASTERDGAVWDALAATIGAGASNDSALLATQAWVEVSREPGRPGLRDVLARGRGGNRVRAIGLGADVIEVAEKEIPVLAELRRDPLRVVGVR